MATSVPPASGQALCLVVDAVDPVAVAMALLHQYCFHYLQHYLVSRSCYHFDLALRQRWDSANKLPVADAVDIGNAIAVRREMRKTMLSVTFSVCRKYHIVHVTICRTAYWRPKQTGLYDRWTGDNMNVFFVRHSLVFDLIVVAVAAAAVAAAFCVLYAVGAIEESKQMMNSVFVRGLAPLTLVAAVADHFVLNN